MGLSRAAFAALVFFPVAAAAQMYQWKDAEGRVHYSDQPPTGNIPSRTIKERPSLTGDPGAARKGLAGQNMDFRKRQGEKESAAGKAEKEKQDAEERARNCEQARTHMRNLESGQRMVATDEKGQQVVLDDAGRAKEKESAQKAIDGWCK